MKKWLLLPLSIASLHAGGQECWNECKTVLSSARVCPDADGLYISGSYLYWFSKLEQIPIVTNGSLAVPNTSFNELKEMTYDWRSGVKAGIGYNFGGDKWDLFLNWTYIRPEAKGHFHVGPGPADLMLAILADGIKQGHEIEIIVCREASSNWHLNFNTLDLELGRDFYVGCDLSIRPFAGVKAGVLNQKLHVEYHDNAEFDVVDPSAPLLFSLTTQDFTLRGHVIGPRIGINTRWNVCSSPFAILANGSVSLLWNHAKIESLGTVQDPNPNFLRHDLFVAKDGYMEPVFELFLGFDWRQCFCNTFALDFSAGYEMQLWLNQTQTPFGVNASISNERNLSLQGLTASVKFEF